MISKRSSKANAIGIPFMEYTKRRIAVVALMALYTLLGYVVLPIMWLSQNSKQYAMYYFQSGMPFETFMQDAARGILGFTSPLFVGVIILAIITGIQGFYWIYKTRSVDFYESQPVKRITRYLGIIINNMVIYAVITGIGTVISLIIAGAMGAGSGAVFAEVALEYVRLVILFFSLQAISVLAVMLSKNVIVAVILDAIFLFGEILIRGLRGFLMSEYYTTFYTGSFSDGSEHLPLNLTSPIADYFNTYRISTYLQSDGIPSMAQLGECISKTWGYELYSLAIGIVVTVVAYLIYRRRPSEAIGSGVIYKPFAAVIKLIVAIPVAVFAGIVVDEMFETQHYRMTVIVVFIIILAAVISCAIAETVDAGSVRAMIKRAWQMPIAVVLALFIVIFYKNDIGGYDRYVPAEEKIADISLYGDWYYRNYYEDASGQYADAYVDSYFKKYMHLGSIDELRKIATVSMDAQRRNTIAYANYVQENNGGAYGTNDYEIKGYDAYIVYHMKNGKDVTRHILIPQDIDRQLMDKVTGDRAFKDVVYQTEIFAQKVSMNARNPKIMYDAGYGQTSEFIKTEMFDELMAAYSRDLDAFNFSYCVDHNPIGVITYEDDAYDTYNYNQFEVYEDYTETINWLHRHGVWLEPGIPTDRIDALTIVDYVYDDSEMYQGTRKLEITDPREMDEIARVAYNNNGYKLWSNSYYNDTLEIDFSIMPGYSVLSDAYSMYGPETYYNFVIDREDLPDDIRDRLESEPFDVGGDYVIYD